MAPVRSAWRGVTPQLIDDAELVGLIASLESIAPPAATYADGNYAGEPVDVARLVSVLDQYPSWPFEEQVQLTEWVRPLNAIDASLNQILRNNPNLLLVDPVERKSSRKTNTPESPRSRRATTVKEAHSVSEQVLSSTKSILRFLIGLFRNSSSKSAFNSVDEVADLLGAVDDEVSSLALEALAALVTPPALHRQQSPEGHHNTTTPIHASKLAVHRRLIALARGWGSRGAGFGLFQCVTSDDSEQGQGSLSAEAGEISFQYFSNEENPAVMEVDGEEKREESDDRGSSKLETLRLAASEIMLPGNPTVTANVFRDCSKRREAKPTVELFFQCLERTEGRFPSDQMFALLVEVRLASSFYSRSSRVDAAQRRLLALSATLNSHPSADTISGYFQAQPELCVELVDLLRPTVASASLASGKKTAATRSGLSSLESLASPPQVPFRVRSLAMECLTALVARRDGSHAVLTGVARLNNVLNELGIGKGIYLGILPTLVRYTLASLNSFLSSSSHAKFKTQKPKEDEDDVALDVGFAFVDSTQGPSLPAKQTLSLALEFTETLLTMASAVVSAPNGTASLVDSGLIPSLLEVIATETKAVFPSSLGLADGEVEYFRAMLRLVSAQAIQVLEGTLVTHNHAASAIHDLKGSRIVVNRMHEEIVEISQIEKWEGSQMDVDDEDQGTSQTRALSTSRRVLLFSAMNFLSVMCHHESSSTTATTAELMREPQLTSCLLEFFRHVTVYDGILVAMASSFLSDIMNSDPQVVHHVHNSGIGKAFLEMCNSVGSDGEPCLPTVPELIISVPNVLSALALTSEGAKRVEKANPFPSLIKLLYHPKYVMPRSNCLLNEICSVIGPSFDEIMRHVPSLRSLVVKSIVEGMKDLVKLGTDLVDREEGATSLVGQDDSLITERSCLMQYAMNFGHLLEQILQTDDHCGPLFKAGVMETMLDLQPCLMATSSEFLANASCASCPSITTLCHTTTEGTIQNAFKGLIGNVEPQKILRKLINAITKTFGEIENSQAELRGLDQASQTSVDQDKPVNGILRCIPDQELHLLDRDNESRRILCTSRFLRNVTLFQIQINCLCTAIRSASQRSQDSGTGWGRDEREWKKELSASDFEAIFNRAAILQRSAFRESCWYRSQDGYEAKYRSRISAEATKRVRFRLRIVNQEGAVVRDGIEIDSCLNVGGMEMGEIVVAYGRCLNSSGVMRYRTKRGWVSELTRGHSREAISEVIDVWQAVDTTVDDETSVSKGESITSTDLGVATLRDVGSSILARLQNSYCDLLVSLSRVLSQSARVLPARTMSFDTGTVGAHVQSLNRIVATHLRAGLDKPDRDEKLNEVSGVEELNPLGSGLYTALMLGVAHSCLFEDRRERRVVNLPLLLRLVEVERDGSVASGPLLSSTASVLSRVMDEVESGLKDPDGERAPSQLLSRGAAAMIPPAIALLRRLLSSTLIKSSPLSSLFERMEPKHLSSMIFEAENRMPSKFEAETYSKRVHALVANSMIELWRDARLPHLPSHVLYPLASLSLDVVTAVEDDLKPTKDRDGRASSGLPGPLSRRTREGHQAEEFVPNEETISTIMEMGFSRDHALEAVERTESNRLEVAMEYALSHPPPSPSTAERRRAERAARAERRRSREGERGENDGNETQGSTSSSSSSSPEQPVVDGGEGKPDDGKEKDAKLCEIGEKSDEDKVTMELRSLLGEWVQVSLDLGLKTVDTPSCDTLMRYEAEHEAQTIVAATSIIELCRRYKPQRREVFTKLLQRLKQSLSEESSTENEALESRQVIEFNFARLCHITTLFARAFTEVRLLLPRESVVEPLIRFAERGMKRDDSLVPSRWLSQVLLLLDVAAQPIAAFTAADLKGEEKSSTSERSELCAVKDEHRALARKQDKLIQRVFAVLNPSKNRIPEQQQTEAPGGAEDKRSFESSNKKPEDDNLSSPPAFAPLMSSSLQHRCAQLCVAILKGEFLAGRDECPPGVVHSCLLLLTQLARSPSVARYCISVGAPEKVMSLTNASRFSGRTGLVATLFRRLVEDESTLQSSMETAIRGALVKRSRITSSQSTEKPRVGLSAFFDSVTPLLCRDSLVFVKAAAVTISVSKDLSSSSVQETVTLLTSDERARNQKLLLELDRDDAGAEKPGPLKRQRSLSKGKVGKSPLRRTSSAKKARKERNSSARLVLDGSPPSHVSSLVVSKIIEQCLVEDGSDYGESSAFLWVADLVEILGDLVLAVPACAAAIHRFRSRVRPNPLSNLRNALSNAGAPPRTFVSLLLHELLPIDRWSLRKDITSTLNGHGDRDSTKITSRKFFMASRLLQTSGRLLVALVARAGEGRRRVVNDLARAMGGSTSSSSHLHSERSSASSRHHSALRIWGELCFGLASPKGNLAFSESSSPLSYEVVKVMLESGIVPALLTGLASVDLESSYASSTCMSLLIPLELFTRSNVTNSIRRIEEKEAASKAKKEKTDNTTPKKPDQSSLDQPQRRESQFADDAMLEEAFSTGPVGASYSMVAMDAADDDESDIESDSDPMEVMSDDNSDVSDSEEDSDMDNSEDDEDENSVLSLEEQDEDVDGSESQQHNEDWQQQEEYFDDDPGNDMGGGGAVLESDMEEGWTRIESPAGLGNLLVGATGGRRILGVTGQVGRGGSRGIAEAAQAMLGNFFRSADIPPETVADIEENLGIRITHRDSGGMVIRGSERSFGTGQDGGHRTSAGEGLGTLPQVGQRTPPEIGYTGLGFEGGRLSEVSSIEYIYGGPALASGSRNYDLSHPLEPEPELYPAPNGSEIHLFPTGAAGAANLRARRTFHPLLHGVELPPVNSLVSDLLPQDTRALRRNHPAPPRRYSESGSTGVGFTLLSSSGGVSPRRRDFRTTSNAMIGWSVHDDLPLEPTLGDLRSEFLRAFTAHAERPIDSDEPTQCTGEPADAGVNESASATSPEPNGEAGNVSAEGASGPSAEDAAEDAAEEEQAGPASDEQPATDTAPQNREDSERVASSLAAGLRISGSDNMSTDESGDRETQPAAGPPAADGGICPEAGNESVQQEDGDVETMADAEDESVANNVEETAGTGQAETRPNENGFICPPGMDTEAFNALPAEVQQEVVNQHRITEEVSAQLDPSSGLDPGVLAELPEDMRREAIAQDRREREEAARSAQPADPSNATEMDNASFLVSLAPDLREEILLTADENFLNSLPPNVLAEAQLLRERASVRHQNRVPDDTAVRSNRETNEGQQNANSGSRRRRTRVLTGKVKVDSDRSQVIFVPQSQKETKVVAFGYPQMQTILRLFFLLSPVRPHRLLQKLCLNLSSNQVLRAALIGFFTKVLNDDLPAARESLARIGSSDVPDDDSFPPSTLIGASPSTCDADQATQMTGLFRFGRQGTLSDAIASNLPKSSMGSVCVGSTPVVVSARLIDTCNYLGANSQRFCVDMMGGIGLESIENGNCVGELIDLLASTRFKTSSANLEQLLQMLETLLAPLGSVPFSGSEESEVSQGDLDAAASASKEYVDVPRVVIPQERLRLLCSVLKLESCKDSAFTKVNTIVKRLSRVDANRGFILSELGTVAHALGADAIRELRALKIRMDDTIALKATREPGTGPSATEPTNFNGSSSVTLSNTSSEVKLLRALTTLQSLCTESDSTDSLHITQELVDMLRDIDLGDLWKELSGCLDSVKTLEGIEDTAEEIDDKDGDNEEDGDGDDDNRETKKLKNSAAGLLTRFLPSIETFFVVNASSTRPDEATEKNEDPSGTAKADSGQSSPSLVGGKQLTSFVSDNRILINALIRNSPSLLDKKLSAMVQVEYLRCFLDFDVKRQWFKSQIRRLRHQANRRHGSLRLAIRRKYVFEDTYHQLRLRNADEMRGRLNISFTNEEGVDAGGLSREFFAILAKEMFNPNYALFTATEDGCTFQPNPNSSINPDHLSYLRFVGRIVGKAVSDGYLLDAHFTRSLYKHMLGLQPTHHDMEAIDPDYYKNLKMILEYSLADIGLELTFSIDDHSFGRNQVIDLIPNGRKVAVTDATKAKYVQLVCKHRMTTAISGQIKAFLDGFYEMVSRELIAIFTPRELELLISGLPDIDVLDLKKNTDYNGYKATDKEIQWFWNIMMTLTRPQKAAFLQFVTGSSKVPLAGFAELQGMRGIQKFSITKAGGPKGALMSAHTCFNSLDLPLYNSEEEMKEKLLYAISEGQGAFLFA